MIETTLGELTVAAEPMVRLTTLRLPAATAYHVARLARLVAAEVQLVQDQRTVVIKELGEVRPATEAERALGSGGEVTEVLPAQRAAFNQRMIELANVPTTLAVPRVRLTVAAMNGCAITPADLIALEPFVEIVEAEP